LSEKFIVLAKANSGKKLKDFYLQRDITRRNKNMKLALAGTSTPRVGFPET
jgi:hypothetical protein